MRIERKRIADMNRAAYNPRVELRPGDEEYEALYRNIDKFGLVVPIVWNKRTNNIVGGHQRITVLENIGIGEVDVSVVDLDLQSEKQLNIALNKIEGNWDDEKLTILINELGERAVETGFSFPEIELITNDIDSLLDKNFLDEEQAGIEQTFNISLKFSKDDKSILNDYVKEYGKESLVKLIIDKVKGEL